MKKAVLDACVLYPAPLRDILLSIAGVGCFQPYWSDEINEEWRRNLLKDRPDLQPGQIDRTIEIMNSSFQSSCITGINSHIGKVTLPDPDDRHVVAAAIESKANYIITNNLKDFPAKALKPHSIIAISPDEFIEELIVRDDMLELIIKALADQRNRLRKTPISVSDFIENIKKQGLKKLAKRLVPRGSDL